MPGWRRSSPAPALDPERSWQRTHDILAGFGGQDQIFQRHLGRRTAQAFFGYAQCRRRHHYPHRRRRIFEVDDAAFDAFLKSSKSVAETEFPYVPLAPTSSASTGR
ncbi:MAG: hypothetical protein WDN06_15250 [Asticcacaulis sp.]